ncbi:hypothetical protein Lal_00018304 [Lupinus albus]|uniref:Putative EEIG1/EHBP1 domain-containing protein n=1 Tax=Lupinus albus TaxID=3870 RepID=A0A6A4N5V6_LUPAL|nr:putative EEIG1/EHBP1 domain-containing protein [Lupinus albus]KAF1866918.1 hypothetical protein Lal_00018304 [Lupinus albus]
MVVKMMRWRPLVSTKYEVRLIVKSLINGSDLFISNGSRLTVEIKWKGPKLTFGSLRRNAVARNFIKEVEFVDGDGGAAAAKVVKCDEEFRHVCNLNAYKDNAFQPWEIVFTVFNELNHRPKNKAVVVGTALLNIGELASQADQKDFDLNIPLTLSSGSVEPAPALCISISLVELRAAQESMNNRSVVPMQSPPAQSVETTVAKKDDLSAIKAGLKKVKILTEYVSSRRVKKGSREGEGSEGKGSRSGEDGEYDHPFDSDSLDDFEEGDPDEGKEESSVMKPFNYGSLAYANAGSAFCCNTRVNCDDEDWVYYSNRRSSVGCSQMDDSTMSSSDPYLLQNSKRNLLLSWRKRKMRFRSPKANKGEPLLKKAYAEEGGDDIDFDRRQLSSDESLSLRLYRTGDNSTANRSPISEFGDDNFAVGSWEQKEVMSRDGHMKLQTQVFFAAIDQRSERAAGESACTALVAVVADWFQNNRNLMPIKSQFNSLIREGSSEWRNLCDNEIYKERFPDKHFDLETVIQAKIRPLSVVPRKSVIGFFHPEGMDEGRFDFLHGAMSFDNIWDEISHAGHECSSDGEPHVYIVSWNDHFFILKVESDAYYIVDTLGERLYEGCNQAYILKFDSDTVIHKMQDVQSSDDKTTAEQQTVASVLERDDRQITPVLERNDKQMQQIPGKEVNSVMEPEEQLKREEEDEVVCRGKESCKEYIKSFLAAIPIRQLQADVKKGLISSTPLHHRLQIEFNYTELSMDVSESLALAVTETTPVVEASMASSETLALALVTEAFS